MARKIRSRYKPEGKIGDQVLATGTRSIGVIKQIDNVCNLRDNNRSVSEYYVYWPVERAWTRHDSYYVDTYQDIEEVILLTGVNRVLYGDR